MVKELQRKQRIKRAVYSIPALIALAILTYFIVRGAVNIIIVERDSASRVDRLEGEVESLREREGELLAKIERLNNEEGIIEEIKRKFAAAREGEHVAIIVDERSKAELQSASSSAWFSDLWQGVKSLFSN